VPDKEIVEKLPEVEPPVVKVDCIQDAPELLE